MSIYKKSFFVLLSLISTAVVYGSPLPVEAEFKAALDLSSSLVKEELKDPFSAVFRNEDIYLDVGGNKTVCGEVNSKNSFGAYTGFQKYVVKMNYEKVVFQRNASNGIEADDETWDLIVGNLCHELVSK